MFKVLVVNCYQGRFLMRHLNDKRVLMVVCPQTTQNNSVMSQSLCCDFFRAVQLPFLDQIFTLCSLCNSCKNNFYG